MSFDSLREKMSNFHYKIRSWENPYIIESNLSLEKGDVIILEVEGGLEPAIVEGEQDQKKTNYTLDNQARIIRKANLSDLSVIKALKKKEEVALKICRREVKKSKLPMKMMGCRYSFDGGSITFVFTAEGRVDFRNLVKDLSKHFQRSIRLHQIGARDEAREKGGYGICGRELCCIRFKGNLPSISSEMAKVQQIIRRGSERISGICGRLMCCLAFEAAQYEKALKKIPPIGNEIKIKGTACILKEANILTGEIKGELPDKSILKGNIEDL